MNMMTTDFVPAIKTKQLEPLPGSRLDTLIRTRALIADENNWCQNDYCDHHGRVCVVGALSKAMELNVHDVEAHPIFALLTAFCPGDYSPIGLNDNLGHHAVLVLLDKAIAAERRQ